MMKNYEQLDTDKRHVKLANYKKDEISSILLHFTKVAMFSIFN